MKILFINPPGWQDGSVSLGLAYLSGALLQKGHEVKIFDFTGKNTAPEAIAAEAREWDPELIGFHVKTAQANTASKISKAIKKIFPHALHVAGGPHVTLCYEEYLKENLEFEYGFSGEADLSFPKFCDGIQKKESVDSIEGMIFRRNGKIILNKPEPILDLDHLPQPCFDVIEGFYWAGFRYPLLTSRGCSYQCNFCSVPRLSGKKFRYRSPQNCIEELARVKTDKGIQSFEILDDNFTFLIDRAKDFCRELIKADLHLSWYCHNGIRADRFDDELARLMKEAGCTSVAFGIESGDESVFRRINKGEKLEDIVQAVAMAREAGLLTVGYFIIGLPGDSLQAVKRTIAFQKTLKLDHYIYGIFIPYPGTKGEEDVLKEGRILRDIREASHFSDRPQVSIEYPYFTKKEIEEAYYLASTGELLDLMETWKIDGSLTDVIFVEMNPPTYAFHRFSRWVEGGVDLLINAIFDGCFELDKKEGSVREVYSYQHYLYRWRMIRELISHFWLLRKKRYQVAFFPFKRRKSVLLFFWAIVGAKHTVLYDFEGSRFVEISLQNPHFRSFLKRYIKKQIPNIPWLLLDGISGIFEGILQRIIHVGICCYLYFRKPFSSEALQKKNGEK